MHCQLSLGLWDPSFSTRWEVNGGSPCLDLGEGGFRKGGFLTLDPGGILGPPQGWCCDPYLSPISIPQFL